MMDTGPAYTDNTLIEVIIDELDALLKKYGIQAEVAQKNQPEQQGVVGYTESAPPGAPVVYVEKLFDEQYGHPITKWKHDEFPLKEYHTQICFSTFQFSTLVRQSSTDIDRPTASDLAIAVCNLFKTRACVMRLVERNIGIHRVTTVRNPYFEDDQDRYEASPNFDMVFTYLRKLIPVEVPNLQMGEIIITNEGPAR